MPIDIKSVLISIVMVIVGFVSVFYLIGGTATTLTTAAGNISNSGLPLANLFAANGVLMIIFMIAVFVALLIMAFKMWGHK